MEDIFLGCAVIGGTLVACQILMTLAGLGGHGGDLHLGDVHVGDLHSGGSHDGGVHCDNNNQAATAHGSHAPRASSEAATNWLFGVLSFRTVVAAVAFFGLTGRAALASGFDATTTLAIAVASGVAAMYGVHALMRGLEKLDTDGTVNIEHAVGRPGRVNLSIPARKSGSGKIQLNLQNQLIELDAMTARDQIPSGVKVKVVGVLGPDSVEVEPLAGDA